MLLLLLLRLFATVATTVNIDTVIDKNAIWAEKQMKIR